jgi:dTDP-4-dehydrorhamnose reductase
VRILVTGAAGQVGTDLQQVLAGIIPPAGTSTDLLGGIPVMSGEFDVVALSRAALDITDSAAVESAVSTAQPDVIVHLAAYTAVDRAESDGAGAEAVNVTGTANVVAAAQAHGSHVVYISTDYVFAGDLGRAMVESDATGPLSVYGSTKLAGEDACRATDTIVRTSWVAGLAGRNVIHLAADAGRSGRELRFVSDQVGSLTASADLAAGLVHMIRNRPPGVFHVAGDGAASWHQVITTAVVAAGGSADQVLPITTAQLDPQPAATRPAYSPLLSERLPEIGGVALPGWQDGVERLVAAIAQDGVS